MSYVLTPATLEERRHLVLPPGKYAPLMADGKLTARVACPLCGLTAILDHEIAADGTVTPSLLCSQAGCGFHEMVVLEAWAELEVVHW